MQRRSVSLDVDEGRKDAGFGIEAFSVQPIPEQGVRAYVPHHPPDDQVARNFRSCFRDATDVNDLTFSLHLVNPIF
jgi:hypothetical protein